jgi:hypothetical protein
MSLIAEARLDPSGYLEARPRPEAGRRGAVLARFLQSDVQGDRTYAEALLAEIAAVLGGAAPRPAAIGNAFSIEIGLAGAVIANAVVGDAPAERYGLAELRSALRLWVEAIARAGGPRQTEVHRR